MYRHASHKTRLGPGLDGLLYKVFGDFNQPYMYIHKALGIYSASEDNKCTDLVRLCASKPLFSVYVAACQIL